MLYVKIKNKYLLRVAIIIKQKYYISNGWHDSVVFTTNKYIFIYKFILLTQAVYFQNAIRLVNKSDGVRKNTQINKTLLI